MAGTAKIPIIDISAEGADEAKVAQELVDAAVEYGFIYIKNTGRDIPAEQIDHIFDLSRTLFGSELEEKQRCKIEKNNQGWSGMHTETLDPKTQRVGDFKEAFNFGPFENGKATQPIPSSLEPHQAALAAFRSACHDLCQRLLQLFGIGLGVNPPSFFSTAHAPHLPSGSILRLLYYPPPSSTPSLQSTDVRAGAHSDYGSITLLFRLRGQAGLEILNPVPSSSSWSPVPVTPPGTEHDPAPPILVNIGDLLSYWTNGLLRSTVHRVSSSTATGAAENGESTTDPRYSVVYFCHPANETPLTPVPSARVAAYNSKTHADAVAGDSNDGGAASQQRKVLTAAEHLQTRLQATYLQMYADGSDEKEEKK